MGNMKPVLYPPMAIHKAVTGPAVAAGGELGKKAKSKAKNKFEAMVGPATKKLGQYSSKEGASKDPKSDFGDLKWGPATKKFSQDAKKSWEDISDINKSLAEFFQAATAQFEE